MKFIVWNKEDIKNITDEQREMWFDIYNNDLFEDRGYDITSMEIEEIEELYTQFKRDYFEYLDSLALSEHFHFYIILVDEYSKFCSQARLITKKNRFVIEGLETHRDCYKRGYAKKIISALENEAVSRGVKTIYANSYHLNIPSIKTFEACGYHQIDSPIEHRICMQKNLTI